MRNDALVISEAVNQLRNDVQIAKATSGIVNMYF